VLELISFNWRLLLIVEISCLIEDFSSELKPSMPVFPFPQPTRRNIVKSKEIGVFITQWFHHAMKLARFFIDYLLPPTKEITGKQNDNP